VPDASSVVAELGSLVSATELAHENLFPVFAVVAAALDWECENIKYAAQSRRERGHE
jgi:hypothetical protein